MKAKQSFVEARAMLSDEPIDLIKMHEHLASLKDPVEAKAFAEALNEVVEEYWKQGKFAFKIKKEADVSLERAGNVSHAVYEGMPATIYSGAFAEPLEDGVVSLRLLFRLGWVEDLTRHQHEGGRMVSIHRGVGKFVAWDDNGNEIDYLMEPDTIVCMPPYTAHNFRALTDAEAVVYVADTLKKESMGEQEAQHLAGAIGDLFAAITWDKNWRLENEQSLRKRIGQITQETLASFDQHPTLLALMQTNFGAYRFLRVLITDLLTLELDSTHVRYVDVSDTQKEYKSLFREVDVDGKQNILWRNADVSRRAHHENVKNF